MVDWSKVAKGVGIASGVVGVGGAIAGGLKNLFQKSDSASEASARQYYYQTLLNQQAYDLTQRGYLESPLNQRIGYESAGVNPIFAMSNGGSFGSYSGGTASAPQDSTTADYGNMATNAYKVMKLATEKNSAEILGINAGIKNTNADTALKAEQVMTERSKQIQMEFQNAMMDIQTHLARKDLSTYDRRFYQEMYESMQRAENYRASASLAEYNAETARMSAEANAYESEFRRKHPIYDWTDRITKAISPWANSAIGAYNATKPVVTEHVKFGSNADYRGHTRTTRRRGR